jgi:hypothetical protein
MNCELYTQTQLWPLNSKNSVLWHEINKNIKIRIEVLNLRASIESPTLKKWGEKVSSKCSYLAIKLHGVTSQNTVLCQENLKSHIPNCSHQLLITISLSGPNILLRTYFYEIGDSHKADNAAAQSSKPVVTNHQITQCHNTGDHTIHIYHHSHP